MLIVTGDDRGDPALTKRICGFDSRLLLGLVIPKTFKNGSGLFLHGTNDEGGTTKHNWSARCQYNVTGWVSMCRARQIRFYPGCPLGNHMPLPGCPTYDTGCPNILDQKSDKFSQTG